jgi:hypothetical protein
MSEVRGALEIAVQQAIEHVRGLDIREAVNWGDLSPAMIADVVPHYGFGIPYNLVVIKEASPDCPQFAKAIREHLNRAGFLNVQVQTEW